MYEYDVNQTHARWRCAGAHYETVYAAMLVLGQDNKCVTNVQLATYCKLTVRSIFMYAFTTAIVGVQRCFVITT